MKPATKSFFKYCGMKYRLGMQSTGGVDPLDTHAAHSVEQWLVAHPEVHTVCMRLRELPPRKRMAPRPGMPDFTPTISSGRGQTAVAAAACSWRQSNQLAIWVGMAAWPNSWRR